MLDETTTSNKPQSKLTPKLKAIVDHAIAKQTCTDPQPIQSPLFTTRQAADYLQLKETTLEQWRWKGCGPKFVKLNRAVRYRKADLDDYQEENVFISTTEAQAR